MQSDQSLKPSPLTLVTRDHLNILSTNCASTLDGHYVVWSSPPDYECDELVSLTKIGRPSPFVDVVVGADGYVTAVE